MKEIKIWILAGMEPVPEHMRLGWVIDEKPGVVIVNEYALAAEERMMDRKKEPCSNCGSTTRGGCTICAPRRGGSYDSVERSQEVTVDAKEIKMKKNLYLVQDSDRPMHVIASSWENAIDRWEVKIRIENNMEDDDPVESPMGIFLIAEENDLII